MKTLLILQFIAHLLADFYFQPQKWCDMKERNILSKPCLYHTLIVFICSWALSGMVSFGWAALFIALFHLVADVAKSVLFKKGVGRKYLFFIDQILHIVLISSVVYLFFRIEEIHFPYFILENDVFILFALIACTKPANIFFRNFMETYHIIHRQEENNTLLQAGRVIGSLERLISFVLILFDQFAAIGFIIAAKSILRFRDTDTAKTEYLLIGSLLSFGIAIFFGVICR